jgi:hypothetical protein
MAEGQRITRGRRIGLIVAALVAGVAALLVPGTAAYAGSGHNYCGVFTYGAIEDKYIELSASFGPLGCPLGQEGNANRGGRWQPFEHGFIFWHPNYGAHAVYGAIAVKWTESGRENGVLGYPLTDESGTPDGIGRYNHFEFDGSIYWTPRTGAHLLYGAIRERWKNEGWEKGVEGYPTSDVLSNGLINYNTFEHGMINWTQAAGTSVQIEMNWAYSPGPNLAGTGHLTLFSNGSYIFSGQFSTLSFLPIKGIFGVMVKSATGHGYEFSHSGSVNDLPLIGHPKESWNNQGTSTALLADWPFIENGMKSASASDDSLDLPGLMSGLKFAVDGVNTVTAIVGALG